MPRPRFSACWPAALALLSGCALLAPDESEPPAAGWLEYAAAAAEAPDPERRSRLARARTAHEANPSSASAIRLAILLTSSDDPEAGYAAALGLLDFAAAADAGAADRAFIDAFRPLVRQLAEERSRRRSLEDQLEALKALEEQLNAAAEGP